MNQGNLVSVEKCYYKERSYSFSPKTVTPFRNSKEPSSARQQAVCSPKLTANASLMTFANLDF